MGFCKTDIFAVCTAELEECEEKKFEIAHLLPRTSDPSRPPTAVGWQRGSNGEGGITDRIYQNTNGEE